MKRLTALFSTLFVLVQLLQAQELNADIVFEERVFNFGTIEEAKGKVTHTFVFENKGKKPVTISEVNSGCGCIGNVVTKEPVKPGGKGKVTITFDPSYKSGFFSKEVVVFSDSSKLFNRVWVEGTIKPAAHPIDDEYPYNFGEGLHMRLQVLAFGYMNAGESQKMELHYANNTDKEMNVYFTPVGETRGLIFTNPGVIRPNGRGIATFTYTRSPFVRGDVSIKLNPVVNGKKLDEIIEVKVLRPLKKANEKN